MLTQHIDLGHKGAQVRARFAAHLRHGIVQRHIGRAGRVLQLLDAARANATRREVHHPQKAGVVAGVLQQSQIRQRMLDFCALEKAQAPVHTVGQAGIEQRGFNHPALGVAAVQHRDVAALGHALSAIAVLAIAQQLLDLLDQPLRLGEIARGLHDPDQLAQALVGAQVFAQPGFVVANQLVGGVQNGAAAAVILFQLDLVAHRILAHKIGHVAHACATEGINALVIVAHRKHGAVRA